MWLSYFFFKQKTAYEVRISDWSSDVCSSDLPGESVRARDAERSGGINECFREFVGFVWIAHRDRAARAVIGVGAGLLVLGFAEIGQDIRERPADISCRSPIVITLTLAAYIEQAVGGTASAQNLAPRHTDRAAVEACLRHGGEAPVQSGMIEQLPIAQRDVNPRAAIGPAGRSEEHTSELHSLMRISYAVFCLKKKIPN